METATTLLGKQDIKINVEPGMCEALYLCCTPPGFWVSFKLISQSHFSFRLQTSWPKSLIELIRATSQFVRCLCRKKRVVIELVATVFQKQCMAFLSETPQRQLFLLDMEHQ